MKGLMSPEGVLMLCVAASLDVLGFAVFILGTWFGIDDYGIVDIIGGGIIGGWMLLRYSFMGSEGGMKTQEENKEEAQEKPDIQIPQKDVHQKDRNTSLPTGNQTGKSMKNPKSMAGQEVKNLGKKALKRFGLAGLVELIPFLGGLVPAWTIMVYKEMK